MLITVPVTVSANRTSSSSVSALNHQLCRCCDNHVLCLQEALLGCPQDVSLTASWPEPRVRRLRCPQSMQNNQSADSEEGVCSSTQTQISPSNRHPRIVGFLLGFSLASSFAAYHLLEEYKQASAALQASVLELQASTEKARSAESAMG